MLIISRIQYIKEMNLIFVSIDAQLFRIAEDKVEEEAHSDGGDEWPEKRQGQWSRMAG